MQQYALILIEDGEKIRYGIYDKRLPNSNQVTRPEHLAEYARRYWNFNLSMDFKAKLRQDIEDDRITIRASSKPPPNLAMDKNI